MSAKKKTYSADFKAKVVLELLSEGSTLNQIASKYEIVSSPIFYANPNLVFQPF